MLRNGLLAVVVFMLCGVNAFAQGTYVSASVFGDIVRATHSESAGFAGAGAGGEAIGFALRAGTPLGGAWGVEIEFARPGEIEDTFEPGVFPLGVTTSGLFTIPPEMAQGGFVTQSTTLLRPELVYSVRSGQRNTTMSAALWAHQQLSARLAIVYLGGVGFHRTEQQSEFSFPRLVGILPGLIAFPPTRTESVVYGVRPMVGVEARIEMSEHLQLVPGIRLHAASGEWLIRPAIGLAWTF